MGLDFEDRVEIVYREYFSKVEPLWEQTPDALKRLPRGEAMLAEMIGDAWLR